MAKEHQRTQRQHYVPRFLLRGFARGKRRRVTVFDKLAGRCFEAGVSDVAVERGFYDIPVPEGTATLEPGLARLENRAARVIDEIRRDRHVGFGIVERGVLIALVANLHVRGPATRARITDMMQQTKHLLDLMHTGRPPASQQIRDLMSSSPEDAKAVAMRLTSDPTALTQPLVTKQVVLLETTKACPFMLADAPVVLSNSLPAEELRGNLGFGAPGVEIYLPISESLTLGFYSLEAATLVEKASRVAPDGERQLWAKFMESMQTGHAVAIPPDHVTRLNSLQICFAERFLYAGEDVFEPARAAIAVDGRLRSGPRMTVMHPLLDEERRAQRARDGGHSSGEVGPHAADRTGSVTPPSHPS